MGNPFVTLVVLALTAGAIWYVLRPTYVFVVSLDGGRPRVTQGKATAAFLQDVGDVCAETGVARGWVGGVRRGKNVALAFSRDLPLAARQRLRNLWELHR